MEGWGLIPWGGKADGEIGNGTGFWGSSDSTPPIIYGIKPSPGSVILSTTAIQFCTGDPRDIGVDAGIDQTLTVITVIINGVTTIVFQNSTFHADWNADSTVVPELTPPGYCFSIIPDSGSFPSEAEITVTVIVFNTDGVSTTESFSYTVIENISIESVEALSLRRLIVRFTTPVKNESAALILPSNWTVRPIPGNLIHDLQNEVIVRSVVLERKRNPTFVILDVSTLTQNQRYEVRTREFSDIFSQAITASSGVAIEARRTKITSILDNLPPMWRSDQQFSNLFWVLSAIARSDEEIGGDKGITTERELRRRF